LVAGGFKKKPEERNLLQSLLNTVLTLNDEGCGDSLNDKEWQIFNNGETFPISGRKLAPCIPHLR